MRAEEVFEDLLEEGLAGGLDADREGDLGVHKLLLEGGQDDSIVSLP